VGAIRIDERLAAACKPSVLREPELILQADDLLVLCAGFEERSVAWLRRLVQSGSRRFSVLVCEYHPAVPQNRGGEVRALIAEADGRLLSMPYSREEPAGAGERVLEAARGMRGRTWVDISGMSRLLIVQIVVAAFEARMTVPTLLYAEAAAYPPSQSDVETAAQGGDDPVDTALFLSSGVFEVTIVPELSSVAMQGQPIRLVAFPSFNAHQMLALRSEIQASYWTFVNGVPPSERNRWRMEALRQLNRVDSIPLPVREEFEASTLRYEETLGVLLSVYAAHGSLERILVAPTGSKMQSVAVGVFRGALSDVQIVYPTPRAFLNPSRFTLGVEALYSLDVEPLRLEIGPG
jgi:hypothetical protein